MHTGAAAALIVARRQELADQLRRLDLRQVSVLALATGPAALVGWRSERKIEAGLGTPATIAAGLLAGALAMALADRSPEERSAPDARLLDGLWLGVAQASALMPGVSRNGATLAAARWLRFSRAASELLSRQLAYPVIAGATLLKAWRLRAWQRSARPTPQLPAAAVASFASTLLTLRLLGDPHHGRRLLPYSLYRTGLAIIILARLRRDLVLSAQNQGQGRST